MVCLLAQRAAQVVLLTRTIRILAVPRLQPVLLVLLAQLHQLALHHQVLVLFAPLEVTFLDLVLVLSAQLEHMETRLAPSAVLRVRPIPIIPTQEVLPLLDALIAQVVWFLLLGLINHRTVLLQMFVLQAALLMAPELAHNVQLVHMEIHLMRQAVLYVLSIRLIPMLVVRRLILVQPALQVRLHQ